MGDILQTAFRLRPINIGRFIAYKAGIRTKLNSAMRIKAPVLAGPFFRRTPESTVSPVKGQIETEVKIFGWHAAAIKDVPRWNNDYLNESGEYNLDNHWSDALGSLPVSIDIKQIWELSRFQWLVHLAKASQSGDPVLIDKMNLWLSDWCKNVPPYRRLNWCCGQEASIRVLHMTLAAVLTGQHGRPCSALLNLIEIHLERIAPTLQYAIAQQNNHGVSEAAALYIGGSWLQLNGSSVAKKWSKMGYKYLSKLAEEQIAEDGSWCQYSTNYHRVVLDIYSFVEYWRRQFDLSAFPDSFSAAMRRLVDWMHYFVDPNSGEVPNLGTNDGSRILPIGVSDYRDFRPSLQLASNIFNGSSIYEKEGSWDLPLQWLALEKGPVVKNPLKSVSLDDGGYHILRCGRATAFMNYPRFKFRPSQADALHCDLWIDGKNLVRDCGTFSYNQNVDGAVNLGATSAHNTIEFDDRDQMPRLGQFLYGRWLESENVELVKTSGDSLVSAAAGYTDHLGCKHTRSIELTDDRLKVVDIISGFRDQAVLRWHLAPLEWTLEGNKAQCDKYTIIVDTDVASDSVNIVQGWESLHYLEKQPIPVLELRTENATIVTTEILF